MKLLTNTEFITAKLLGAEYITRDKNEFWGSKVFFWKDRPVQETEGVCFGEDEPGWVYVSEEDDKAWVGSIDARYSGLDYGEEARLDEFGGYEIYCETSTILVYGPGHDDGCEDEEEYEP